MQLSTLHIVAIVLVVLAPAMFLRAALRGGRMIGGFLDRRESRDGAAD